MATVQRRSGDVTFILNRIPMATRVYLAGDFNNWSPSAQQMTRMQDGTFQARVRLSRGEHQYKFVADGVWMDDPEAAARAPNPFGTTNSVVRVS
jgi:1,4-alpha-glucan branching enzyme